MANPKFLKRKEQRETNNVILSAVLLCGHIIVSKERGENGREKSYLKIKGKSYQDTLVTVQLFPIITQGILPSLIIYNPAEMMTLGNSSRKGQVTSIRDKG